MLQKEGEKPNKTNVERSKTMWTLPVKITHLGRILIPELWSGKLSLSHYVPPPLWQRTPFLTPPGGQNLSGCFDHGAISHGRENCFKANI